MTDETRPEGVAPETPEGAGDTAGARGGAGRAGGPDARTHHSYSEGGPGASAEPGGEDEYDHAPEPDAAAAEQATEGDVLAEEDTMAATLLADLQRLQAEYVNYKKRVDRDRELIRHTAVGGVVESLLPVLDDIHSAREAGALEGGPFAAIADKLETILGRFGVERLGASGEEFDPNVHEALMHVQAELPEGATGPTVVQVIQPGYRIGDRLVRAARVSVADPD
ncbi:nucleotide exchange factor GrpE [Intrasporangium calvum]|uniref:Protein GrpE n=1 Tax=Intrasporangium calvum TaxID=53358 RepID=A0ABT5GH88_9MICO|nr:nucleotide exchange factor GrpE [Intrasporangium calvum]MDC5697582.1 nucleotide exchange factor GrpE [Intrasporangium calvum]